MWDNRMRAPQGLTIPLFDVRRGPDMPPDKILSPPLQQCVQEMPRLTGKTSQAATLNYLDSPTLHNSPQKIKQLTGLDVSWGGPGQSQRRSLQALQESVSPLSVSSSMYSQEGLETTISEPDMEPSIYPYQYAYMGNELNEFTTPLSPPNFGASPSRPIPTAPLPPTSTPSGFGGGNDPEVTNQVGSLPPADNESQHSQESGADSWTSSWGSSLTDRVVDLYHNTTSDIAKSSATPVGNRRGEAERSPTPASEQRSVKWDTRPDEMLQKSRLNISSSSPPPDLIDPFRKAGSFSDRRAAGRSRIPPPLVPSREAPQPGRYTLPKRTPYPPSTSGMRSAFDDDDDDDDDGEKRFSILSKVFGSGGGSSSDKPESSKSRSSWASPPAREDRNPAVPVWPNSLRRVEAPGAPWSNSAANHGRQASSGTGVFQRTMESARQSVGLKSKAEKRREDLRGKIRVVGIQKPGGYHEDGS